MLPGLALTAGAVLLAALLARLVPAVSALTTAVVLGVVVGNTVALGPRWQPGLAFAAHRLLRAGIVLLGLRLALGDVVGLGARGLVVVGVVVLVSFVGTQWLGRRLGLSPAAALLVATGFAICGASAVAAMAGVVRHRKEDAATAVALVTLFGSLAIVLLPLLQRPLALTDAAFGAWVGASVHDVAQTVAAAGVAGSTALTAAVLVKLTRVVLLAPLVAAVSLWQRRRAPQQGDASRPPVVPLFVLGFLVAVLVRSSGQVPAAVLDVAAQTSTLLLAAALFGLGTSVQLRRLAGTGRQAVVLGAASWAAVCTLAYAGVVLVGVA